MRPRTLIGAVAIAALAAALVGLFVLARRPGSEVAAPELPDPEPAPAPEARPALPDREPAPEPAPDPEAGDAAPRRRDQPRIYVRPVPGAKLPDEITADNLADITVQRDAAPPDSEAARVQAVIRLHRQRRYGEALDGALAILQDHPDNARMRDTAVALSCVLRDAELAREHYARLSETQRRRARSRCEKYGIELEQ